MKHSIIDGTCVRPTYDWVELKSGVLVQSTEDAAGFDIIYPHEDAFVMPAGKLMRIPTGVITKMAPNMVGIMKEKSGMSLKGIEVKAGVIDHSYRQEWNVVAKWVPPDREAAEASGVFTITKGMKVAQVIFIALPSLTLLGEGFKLESVERTGGFGSSGTHLKA